jgi:hypothetical protein
MSHSSFCSPNVTLFPDNLMSISLFFSLEQDYVFQKWHPLKMLIYLHTPAFPNVYNFFSCDSCSYVMQISVSNVLVVLAFISMMPQYQFLKTLEITASVIKDLKSRCALLFICLASPFAALHIKCLSVQSPSNSLDLIISQPLLNAEPHTSDQEAGDKQAWLMLPPKTTSTSATCLNAG